MVTEISSLCRRTDRLLWEALKRSESQPTDTDRCRLLFPERSKQELRVSEQEARFACVEALCTGGQFRYSVETPTDKTYQFTGTHGMSAQTDLTVYDRETKRRLCNIEFKSGGISPDATNKDRIYKDVQKLLREPVWGLWFHLLDSTDNSTITKSLEVIRESISYTREKHSDLETEGLILHVCVLKHGFSLQKDVPFSEPLAHDDSALRRHLEVDLDVSQVRLREVKELNGWNLHQRSQDNP